jgi:DeoR/GlpR family transcriptional regulator of sugar metabolism
MKVAAHVVNGRRERLAQLLRSQGYLPLAEVCERLRISPATARRDLAALESARAITRTYGGALMEYDQRFASFRERQQANRERKARIARAALALIKPGATCFMDAGTTMFALAEAIMAAAALRPLTVVTNNLSVAEHLAAAEHIDVEVVGGRFASRQRVLLGDKAERSLKLWRFDVAFLGAEGIDGEGLWNSQADVVAFQRQVAAKTPRVAYCVDASKLAQRAPEFLLPWAKIDRLVTDASLEQLRSAGIPALKRQVLAA